MLWIKITALLIISPLLFSRGGAEIIKTSAAKLGITIMGSIIQQNAAESVALIKDMNGVVTAVRKDHIIGKKYKVLAVYGEYIHLTDREGKQFNVYHDKFISSIAPSQPPHSSTRDSYKEEGFERHQGQISMSASYRDKLIKNDLAKILMQATAEPHYEHGQIVGFKLTQIDENSIYEKSGIQNQDIITSIDGVALNNVTSTISLLQNLKTANQIHMEILRNGKPLKISIQVH